jgi:hypothetical protein
VVVEAGDKTGVQARELIEAVERQWRDALCAGDMELLRSLIHPRFVLIGTRASGPFTMTRDEWLEAIQRRELVSIKLTVEDATVLDQVMVGTVHAKWCVKYLGRSRWSATRPSKKITSSRRSPRRRARCRRSSSSCPG